MAKKKSHKYVSVDNLAAWLSRLATITILGIIVLMQLWIIAHL